MGDLPATTQQKLSPLSEFVVNRAKREDFYPLTRTHEARDGTHDLEFYVSREFPVSEVPPAVREQLVDTPALDASCVLVIVWIPAEYREAARGSYVYMLVFREGWRRASFWAHLSICSDYEPASDYLTNAAGVFLHELWQHQERQRASRLAGVTIFE